MKKSLSLLLVLLYLLSGCAIANDSENDLASLIQSTELHSLYFATGNDYYDLYPSYSWMPGPEIHLLSRTHIDPESIQIFADIQAEVAVYIQEQPTGATLTSYEIIEGDGTREVCSISSSPYDFPLYLYQTYAGIDWSRVGTLYDQYCTAIEAYRIGEADSAQVNAALDAYNYAATEYISDYMKLTTQQLPTYYCYTIQIKILNAAVEESLKTVQVAIGDTVYDVDIGQIRIHPMEGSYSSDGALMLQYGPPLWLSCYPYGVGIERCQTDTWYVQEPVTLTGLRYLENSQSTAEVLDLTVVLADHADDAFNGTGIEIPWDGQTPIYVEQGKYICMFLTVQDERMKEISYHSKLYPVLEYEHDGKPCECITELLLYRNYSDRWLLYALGLDGLNMESYFNNYYYSVVSTWRSQGE